MIHELTIDKIPLRNFGVWFDGGGSLNNAAPDISTVKVPGRNGDLIFSNERYNNLDISYNSFIHKGFVNRFEELKGFLYGNLGYRRIEDSHLPNRFRIGRITGNLNPSNILWGANVGLFKITFDCKPQLFLTDGETVQTFTANGTILNPTAFDAKPLLRVYGTGTFTINGYTINVLTHTNIPYIDIDCEVQEGYCEKTNCNAYLQITNDTFPKLSPGANSITKGSGLTKIEITPRWFSI